MHLAKLQTVSLFAFLNMFRTFRYFAGYAFYRRHFIVFSLQHELSWESDIITVSSLYDLSLGRENAIFSVSYVFDWKNGFIAQ